MKKQLTKIDDYISKFAVEWADQCNGDNKPATVDLIVIGKRKSDGMIGWCAQINNIEIEYYRKEKAINYSEYIQSPEWAERSNLAKERVGFKCQLCNKEGDQTTLHAHHRTYERLGHEHYTDITILCAECHAKFHDIEAK